VSLLRSSSTGVQSDTEFHDRNEKADIADVAVLCGSIAAVIRELSPDLLAIEEVGIFD
jgi:hypothetical protein